MMSRCNEEQAKLRRVCVEDLWNENGSDLQHQQTVASGPVMMGRSWIAPHGERRQLTNTRRFFPRPVLAA